LIDRVIEKVVFEKYYRYMSNSLKENLSRDIEEARNELIKLRILLGINPNDPIPGIPGLTDNLKVQLNTDPLPDGWKEMVEKTTGKKYYVNK
jgi:hypothetical protein